MTKSRSSKNDDLYNLSHYMFVVCIPIWISFHIRETDAKGAIKISTISSTVGNKIVHYLNSFTLHVLWTIPFVLNILLRFPIGQPNPLINLRLHNPHRLTHPICSCIWSKRAKEPNMINHFGFVWLFPQILISSNMKCFSVFIPIYIEMQICN